MKKVFNQLKKKKINLIVRLRTGLTGGVLVNFAMGRYSRYKSIILFLFFIFVHVSKLLIII